MIVGLNHNLYTGGRLREKRVDSCNNMSDIKLAENALLAGEVIAYPTEAVFGVGCDPDNEKAIEKLLTIKKRPVEKGLILVAAEYQQLIPYIDSSKLSSEKLSQILDTWPGPITWVFPASPNTSKMVTGKFNTVAVRVSDHKVVQQICSHFKKPITSTSANLSGLAPCLSAEEVKQQLGEQDVVIIGGNTGGRANPSEIRDALTQQVLRKG